MAMPPGPLARSRGLLCCKPILWAETWGVKRRRERVGRLRQVTTAPPAPYQQCSESVRASRARRPFSVTIPNRRAR